MVYVLSVPPLTYPIFFMSPPSSANCDNFPPAGESIFLRPRVDIVREKLHIDCVWQYLSSQFNLSEYTSNPLCLESVLLNFLS